jgi:hypothetical protein
MFNQRINIPPGDSHYVVKTSTVMPQDVELLAITPHAHLLGREMKIDAHLPNGSVEPLIRIKDWDFNWQGAYQYAKPVSLPKGTRVEMEYTYDNSENNPRNPANPPVRVRWGEQTTDEMAVTFLSVVLPTRQDAEQFQRDIQAQYFESLFYPGVTMDDFPPDLSPQQKQRIALAFSVFDRNHDGKLDAEEAAAIVEYLRRRQ